MVFVVAVGAMMVLAELGVDLKPILTAAGLAASNPSAPENGGGTYETGPQGKR